MDKAHTTNKTGVLKPHHLKTLSCHLSAQHLNGLTTSPENYAKGTKPLSPSTIFKQLEEANKDRESLYEYLEDWAKETDYMLEILLELLMAHND